MASRRRATHSGTWYSSNGKDLSDELDKWLEEAGPSNGTARAIVAPHAGYYYCGSCGAHAYKQVDPTNVKRIFILGPSHHFYLSGCALTKADLYCTPLYDLTVDKGITQELHDTGHFEFMTTSTDEDEHSLEMHLPYIAKVMQSKPNRDFTVIPILVGSLKSNKEKLYGRLLSKYLADPENLFVISSDFCHWGSRFNYTLHNKSHGDIYQFIEHLDKMGMSLIEDLNPQGFSDYLKKYSNTICGRHPIGVLLNAIETMKEGGNGHKVSFKFLKYNQSSRCVSSRDSSVSYAAGALTITKT